MNYRNSSCSSLPRFVAFSTRFYTFTYTPQTTHTTLKSSASAASPSSHNCPANLNQFNVKQSSSSVWDENKLYTYVMFFPLDFELQSVQRNNSEPLILFPVAEWANQSVNLLSTRNWIMKWERNFIEMFSSFPHSLSRANIHVPCHFGTQRYFISVHLDPARPLPSSNFSRLLFEDRIWLMINWPQ